ncbi:MAG: adenylate kinase [Chloroflexi bacterium]|nr:adenylate kinase [Chloroflexota bacterium]
MLQTVRGEVLLAFYFLIAPNNWAMCASKRILVVGTSGAGKTTTAGRIAAHLRIPHTELDAIHWQANWQMLELNEFRRRIQEVVVGDAWVIDGNYSKVRDLILARADSILYLDLPMWQCVVRLMKRTLRRGFSRQELWASNRESLVTSFFSTDSVIYYAIRTHRRNQEQFRRIEEDPAYAPIKFVRLRSQAEIDGWIGQS